LGIGFLQSLIYLLKNRPAAVVGFGGYPSFPPLFAAKFLFIRTVLHEQNSVQGKANRILSKLASVTASSFPGTEGVYVGNPVRADITPSPYPIIQDKVNLLVTGGSQGAKRFAEVVPKALQKYADEMRVVHQVPENLVEVVKKEYAEAGIEAEVKSFFDDMPKRLEWAHLLVARSGASTVAELAIAGRPAIFVPLAIAADDHQRINAESVVAVEGSWMILEKDFTPDSLSALLGELLPTKLLPAAENIRSLAKPDAARALAALITQS
jgi:UDP-N-acetylglucosamine--N-acetylmuramyl-(pentapeptide) pyrophosphoryl-undecaprenol N-acetylglucosamine transferase